MEKAATAEDIREIVGVLDDAVIGAIIDTGATVEEVAEAYAWLTADDSLSKELRHSCQGRAAIVCDLLASEIEAPEEPAKPAVT